MTIENKLREIPERSQRKANTTAVLSGTAGLLYYGLALHQAVSDNGDWIPATLYAVAGTLSAGAAAAFVNYRTHRKSGEQQ